MKFGLVLRVEDAPRCENIAKLWHDNLAMAKIAEDLGFDSVLTQEHHGMPDGWNPAPLVTLAALAAQTRRIRVGSDILQLPLHHPLRVAEEAAMVDVLSNGRLILGVGISNVEREFEMFGLKRKYQAGLLEEGIEILLRAWTEDSFSFSGRHYNFKNVSVTPKPVQKPHPPIWLGAISEAGVTRAARLGLPWITSEGKNSAWLDLYRRTAATSGHEDKIKIVNERYAWIVRDKKEVENVRREWWPHVRAQIWTYFTGFPGRFFGGGSGKDLYPWIETIQKEEDIKFEFFEESLLFGTPEEVIENIERSRKELGFDYLNLQFNCCTGPPFEKTVEALKIFGEKVIPYYEGYVS